MATTFRCPSETVATGLTEHSSWNGTSTVLACPSRRWTTCAGTPADNIKSLRYLNIHRRGFQLPMQKLWESRLLSSSSSSSSLPPSSSSSSFPPDPSSSGLVHSSAKIVRASRIGKYESRFVFAAASSSGQRRAIRMYPCATRAERLATRLRCPASSSRPIQYLA